VKVKNGDGCQSKYPLRYHGQELENLHLIFRQVSEGARSFNASPPTISSLGFRVNWASVRVASAARFVSTFAVVVRITRICHRKPEYSKPKKKKAGKLTGKLENWKTSRRHRAAGYKGKGHRTRGTC